MSFAQAVDLILSLEGGYENDPRDPGGETKYGINQADHPTLDIKNLTIAQAREIYRQSYWSAVRGDELPEPLDLLVFDCAVNQGPITAIKLLQKAVGVVQDGRFGERTLAAVRQATREQMQMFLVHRAMRYLGTRNFATYGNGWLKRLFVVAMAAGGGEMA